MSLETKRGWSVWLSGSVACYYAYSLMILIAKTIQYADALAGFKIFYWVNMILLLIGTVYYSSVALAMHKNVMSSKQVQRLQIISGLFAGFGTQLVWVRLFPKFSDSIFANGFYWAMIGKLYCVLSVIAVALIATQLYARNAGTSKLARYSIIATLFFAVVQIGEYLGVGEIDPVLLLIGVAFCIFTYLFPSVTRMLLQTGTVLFVSIFAIVGAMFNRRI